MLYELKNLDSRAACAENPKGEKSKGGLAGGGHKGSPCLKLVQPGQTVTLLDVEGRGMVRHIWLTFQPNLTELYRGLVLRMYWDGQAHPSVESPVGDFFGIAHGRFRRLSTELTAFQDSNGMNCWIPMPFRTAAKITLENDTDTVIPMLFYQVDFTLGDDHPKDLGYFHAQFRRANCQPYHSDYVILDGIKGKGRYLGTVLGVRSVCLPEQWWGEGEVKMYFDGESQPTICGTGAEDYIGCAWGLGECTTPRQGCVICDHENKLYSFYRWHTCDPICFNESIKVTIMQMRHGDAAVAKERLGENFVAYPTPATRTDTCYYDRSDDYCSVAYWYQTLPTLPFPQFPSREERSMDLPKDPQFVERNDL